MQFCKQILGVNRCTQNDFVYGELGRRNCQSARYVNIIKYWNKLIRTSENKFTKKVYLMLVNDCNIHPNKITWCSLLEDLLGNLGFYEAWLFQDVGNDKVFIPNVKHRLTL